MAEPEERDRLLQKISQDIAGLRAQVDQLSKEAEDVVVGRVVGKATGTIRQMSYAVLFLIIGLAAWAGFSVPNGINWAKSTVKSEAERAAKSAAETYVKEPETKTLLQSTIQARVRELVTSDASSIAVQQAAEVLRELTLLRRQLSHKFNDPGLGPAPPSEEAFAFYGKRDATGKWTVGPYFQPLKGDPKAFPKKGDQVLALGNVFAHINYVQLIPGRGWTNTALSSLQLVRLDDEILVLEGKEVHDGNIWIKFKILKRARK